MKLVLINAYRLAAPSKGGLRPILELRIRKLRVVDFEFHGNSRMDLGIPPLEFKNLIESNPLKSRFLVCGLTTRGRKMAVKIRLLI